MPFRMKYSNVNILSSEITNSIIAECIHPKPLNKEIYDLGFEVIWYLPFLSGRLIPHCSDRYLVRGLSILNTN